MSATPAIPPHARRPRPRAAVRALGLTFLAATAPAVAPATASAATPTQASAARADTATPPGPTAGELAAQAKELADRATRYWRSVQRADGRFPDPVAGGGGDYGSAMLSLALARRGLAASDASLLQAGLNGLSAAVSGPVAARLSH